MALRTSQTIAHTLPERCSSSKSQPVGFNDIFGSSQPKRAAKVPQRCSAVLSSHPDAVRRRQQANARKAASSQDAQLAQRTEWWVGNLPANLITAASPDAFQAAIAQDKLVVASFFAPWCMACRRLFPAFARLAENNPDILFIKVNGGDTLLSKFVESLAVDKLPYFHFYRGGDLILHFAANLSKLNTLRAEIAAQKECVIRSILEPQFLSQPAEDTTQLE